MAASSDQNDFSYSDKQAAQRLRVIWLFMKRKIDFQAGGHLWFPIGTILAIYFTYI